MLPFILLQADAAAVVARPPAPAVPPAIQAMLDAAFAIGNEAEVSTLVKYARAAAPEAADAITASAESWRTGRKQAHDARIQQAGVFDLWTGRAELGGFFTTGNTDTRGATAVLDLTREGLAWRHKVHVQGDFQKSGAVTSREHLLASYEPNLKTGPQTYLYGAAQYETDRFLGYTHRYSASLGAGLNAVRARGVTLDLELGPAFRDTRFTDLTTERSVAARGSLDLDWQLTHAITVRQDASAYLQRANSTVSGTTAVAARLVGPLSAQLSYNVQYESMPPVGRIGTDTTGRASLVYSF